jgi:shikimate kinase
MGRKKLGEVMRTIYFIGFMGSGKTTIGRALSEKLEIPVYDTDEEIIRLTGKSVSELFDDLGEDGFRSLEVNMLKQLPVMDSIVTTGGGIILRGENREWMRDNGRVIYLQATPNEILKRIEGDQTRPLLNGNKRIKVNQILDERMELYEGTAEITIDTTEKSVKAIIQELEQRLKIV